MSLLLRLSKLKGFFFSLENFLLREHATVFLLSDFPVLAQNRFAWMESRWESSLSLFEIRPWKYRKENHVF